MARAERCPKCGLMQMSRGTCKKCGASMGGGESLAGTPRRQDSSTRQNPFAPPRESGSTASEDGNGVYRWGNNLVIPTGAVFPDRCVRCNDSARGYRLKQALSWHPAGFYALLLLSPLIYVIVALAVRKTAKVHVGLCPTHRNRRLWSILAAWLLPVAGVGGCIATIGPESSGLGFLVGSALLLIGLIVALVGVRSLSVVFIDDMAATTRGVSKEFMASLPSR